MIKFHYTTFRFYIGSNYTLSSTRRERMADVMAKAFGMAVGDALYSMDGGHDNYGVWITCRPSQFARFMIYRNDAGIQNGFKDLKAELVEVREIDPYEVLADLARVSRGEVKAVVQSLGYGSAWLTGKLEQARRTDLGQEIDVSRNPA